MAQHDEVSAERRFIGVEEVACPRCGVAKEVVLSIRLDGDEVFGQTHVVDLERHTGGFGFVDNELKTLVDCHYVRHVASFGFVELGAVAENDVPGRAEGLSAVQNFNLMSKGRGYVA